MPTLTLKMVPIGEPVGTAMSYRVRDDPGRLVLATRLHATPEGTEGASAVSMVGTP